MKLIIEKVAKLIDIKSIITIAMTVGILAMMFGNFNPPQEIMGLFCTSYGAITTYFFTKKDKAD